MFRLIVTNRTAVMRSNRMVAGSLIRPVASCISDGGINVENRNNNRNWNNRAMLSTNSITYSGGHASEGQGGFYASSDRASGGEREGVLEADYQQDQRESVLAMAADVQRITGVMKELETLENLLERESDPTTGRSIEIKANIKKLMTQADVLQTLDRLETEGGPVWGLSRAERDMIIEAREKVQQC